MDFIRVWIRVLVLSFNYWSYHVFQSIENALGLIVYVDMSFLDPGLMQVAFILVNLDHVHVQHLD